MASETSQPAIADPILGRVVLGKYAVERKLGQGGMGAVYLLRHRELPDTFAAIKILAAEHRGTMMHERFRQEAWVAATIGSQRVARPIDAGEFDDGIPYFVMEYVEGNSLDAELAHRGPFPTALACRILLRVADTMAVAHHKSIIHRDLKPANIMLTPEGEDFAVKLLDFGVARVSGSAKMAHTIDRSIVGICR